MTLVDKFTAGTSFKCIGGGVIVKKGLTHCYTTGVSSTVNPNAAIMR